MACIDITILNSMADPDFETVLDRHVEWGLRHLANAGRATHTTTCWHGTWPSCVARSERTTDELPT